MTEDLLQYDRLYKESLLGMVRKVLVIVAEHGLPGDHHFYITFQTSHAGVGIPDGLRRQYPEEMTIVLQNTFWDLDVGEEGFSVTLSFNDQPQHLTIPFESLLDFQDRSANGISLPLRNMLEGLAAPDAKDGAPDPAAGQPRKPVTRQKSTGAGDSDNSGGDSPGDETNDDNIVTLDTFRKK